MKQWTSHIKDTSVKRLNKAIESLEAEDQKIYDRFEVLVKDLNLSSQNDLDPKPESFNLDSFNHQEKIQRQFEIEQSNENNQPNPTTIKKRDLVEENINGPHWRRYLNELMNDEDQLIKQVLKVQPTLIQMPAISGSMKRIGSPLRLQEASRQSVRSSSPIPKHHPMSDRSLKQISQEQKHNYIKIQNVIIFLREQSQVDPHRLLKLQQIKEYIVKYEARDSEIITFFLSQIDDYIYCNDEEILHFLGKKNKIQVPFIEIVNHLYNNIKKRTSELNKIKKQNQDELIQLKCELNDMSGRFEVQRQESFEKITNLEKQIQSEKSTLQNTINTLTNQLATANQQLQEQKENFHKSQEKSTVEKNQLRSNYESRTAELKFSVLQLKESNSKLQDQLFQEISERKEFQDQFQRAFISLRNANESVRDLQEKKQILESEVHRLQIRASAGFEELTPRPDFSKINLMLGIPNRRDNKISTADRLEIIHKSIMERNRDFEKKLEHYKSQYEDAQIMASNQQKFKPLKKGSTKLINVKPKFFCILDEAQASEPITSLTQINT